MNFRTSLPLIRSLALGLALAMLLPITMLLPSAATAEPTDNWTQWGGPGQNFRAPADGIADQWGEHGPKQLWSRELGDGYSTILYEDGRLYTMYRIPASEGESGAHGQEAIISLDAATGETIWEHRYSHDPDEGHVVQFGTGPRATPLIAGQRLYTIGIAGMMHSLNKDTGEVTWSHNLWGETFGGNKLNHGYSSSPIEYQDTVIALVGGEGKSIVAFNQKDGSIAWQSMSYQNSYGTPQILEVDGQEQLVAFMAKELIGADPATGEELWRYPQENQYFQNINPPTLVDGQYLFLSSLQAGARGLKLTNQDGKTQVEELWSSRKIQFYHVTSVNDGDWVYGSSGSRSPAFMAAVNVKTGEIPWRKRGFGKANSVYADGRVIVLDEDGKLFLTTATPEDLTVHSEVELLDRVAWSAPTIVGKNMYVRDKQRIMGLDLSASAMAPADSATDAVADTTERAAEASTDDVAEAPAQDSEGVALLKKVDAAVQAIQGLRYRGKAVPTGLATQFMPAAEGEGVMFGWAGSGPEKFNAQVEATMPGSAEAKKISGGSDGEIHFLIDHQTKKAYQDIDPGVMGSGRNALASIFISEFVQPEPFKNAIQAGQVELQGTETIEGVECHKVHIPSPRGGMTWYFSTEDHLPKRRVRHFKSPQGEGTLETTITVLRVDPKTGPKTFRMELPKGYEQVDDFAP